MWEKSLERFELIKADIKDIKAKIKKEKANRTTRREKIKYIREEAFKEYQLIYAKYGQNDYYQYVPDVIQKRMFKYLMKNKLFLDVYEQFGEELFKENLYKIMAEDIKYETGSKTKAFLFRLKKVFTKRIAPTAVAASLALPTMLTITAEKLKIEEQEAYFQEIGEYLDSIKEYGEEIKSYNLTDIQNIMIVMDDMWNRIDGYGEPQIDTVACFGLDVAKEDGVGVCRNMADDFARRINEIDKDYNARTVTVYIEDGDYIPANVNIKLAENQRVEEVEEELEPGQIAIPIDFTKIFGNHAVVFMRIPKDDIELMVDPTNGGLGIYQNGKITVFNSGKENPAIQRVKPMGASVLGINKVLEAPVDFVKSIGFKDIEKIEEKYGIEAQNRALEEVREVRKNTFSNRIKYDVATNTVTVTPTQEIENERENSGRE